MKFLYEEIENEVEIAMSGVPSGSIRASIEGSGSITLKENNIWTVKGLDLAKSKNVNVVLSANVGGRSISDRVEFKVRPLPLPTAYLSYKDENGTDQKYEGGLITRRRLLDAGKVLAAIDDGYLNIQHKVTGFTMMFIDGKGMTIPYVSNSDEFTPQQREQIQNLAKGKMFNISNVKALHPSGRPVNLKYSIEVRVN